MKIAVLGGRFDPPHIGHYLIASQVLEVRKDIDKVLLVPANQHSWKATEATSLQRIEMLRSITSTQIEISEIEIKRGGVSYAIDTIKALKKEYDAEFYWVVGSDIVSEFSKWKDHEDLIKEVRFLVFPRDPYKLPETLPEGFELIESSELLVTNLSSTAIRSRIKNGKIIKYLVPEAVEKYIKENNLYV